MSKNEIIKPVKENKIDLEKEVMAKVASGKIVMKPKWYFILGSLLSVTGFAALSVVSVFLVNITIFTLRRHGVMGQLKLATMLDSFPLWIPILAILGIFVGVYLLRKYDFSYKQNFLLIIFGFIVSVLIAGLIIDQLGLNDIWSKKGVMKGFYQQIENGKIPPLNNSQKGFMYYEKGNGYPRNR